MFSVYSYLYIYILYYSYLYIVLYIVLMNRYLLLNQEIQIKKNCFSLR